MKSVISSLTGEVIRRNFNTDEAGKINASSGAAKIEVIKQADGYHVVASLSDTMPGWSEYSLKRYGDWGFFSGNETPNIVAIDSRWVHLVYNNDPTHICQSQNQ